MTLNMKLNTGFKYMVMALTALIVACQPDEQGIGNGLTATDLDAGFTITEVAGANNTYLLKANKGYISSNWDLGLTNELNFYAGSNNEEVFFPDAGTYTITHKVIGIGGASETVSQQLEVETSDPVAGNLVRGGKFADASDHAEWTILNISSGGANWTFNTGSATIVAGGWNQQAVYQAIEVVAGREYKIDMFVSGNGNTDTWFEVMASTVVPVQGSDYANNVVMGLSTWGEGCALGSFNGWLSSVGCVDNSYSSSRSNTVTFDTSGTIYLVIKCGGNGTSGITIKNVEMRGTN